MLLAADPGDVAPGAAPAPAPRPAVAPPAPGANPGPGYIMVGGKPFYVGNDTTTRPTAAPAAGTGTTGTGTTGTGTAGTGTTGTGFTGAGTSGTVGATGTGTSGVRDTATGTAAGDVTGTTAGPDATAAEPAIGGARGFEGFNDLRAEGTKVIRIPLDKLRNGQLQYNVVIKPKDVIIVQNLPIGEYYMGGHVGRPGAYTLSQRRITLKQAVIAANMLDQLAIPERTDIIRRLGKNREVFVRVNLAKIFAGQQSDIYLQADDQVMVGTNAIAPFLAAARGAFRITYGFGFLYDRNFAVPQSQQNF